MYRVMLDTNILISAIFFPNDTINHFINDVISDDELFICDYVLTELGIVAQRKFPSKLLKLAGYISQLEFKTLESKHEAVDNNLPSVRDSKDTPILRTAIKNNIDVFITGDKDFLCLKQDITKPAILTMSEYIVIKDSFRRLNND